MTHVQPGVLCVDRVKPTAAITSPPAGNVAGAVTVAAAVADNDQVARCQFNADGSNIGPLLTGAPYQIAHDTRSLVNGAHSYGATIWDRVGNFGVAPADGVNVVNAPVINFYSPGNGATVTAGMTLAASVTQYGTGVSVYFYIDGSNIYAQGGGSGTYAVGYDTMALSNAWHTITCIAVDYQGNQSRVDYSVYVTNVPPAISPVAGPTGTIGDWVAYPDDPASWDEWGAVQGGFGPLNNFAVWTGKGYTLQVRAYVSYHADSKSSLVRIVTNDGGGNYWPTGPLHGTGYGGDDYTDYSGWISVPAFGWGQIRARMDITREGGGDYYVHYYYTQIEFRWV